MVTRVEKMVVQGPMKPVIEELDRPYVKQRGDNGPISSPDRKEPDIRNCCIGQIELKAIEDDLVIPGSFPVHLLKVNTAIHDQVLPASGLIAREADPDLVMEHPQQQGW